MKKIIALFLVLSTLNILTISISAHEDQHNEETKFTFVETIVENEITYRSLKIEDSSSISTDDAKEILYSAGMTYSTINNFSPQQIEDVAKYSEIHSIIEYRKVDKYGSNTNVSGEEAVNHAIQARLPSNPGNDETILDGNGGSFLVQSNTKYSSSSYLRLCLNIYKLEASGEYKYSVTAEWLTMPLFRGTDTLGICAVKNTLIYSSCYGWYSYTQKLTVDAVGPDYRTTTTNRQVHFTDSDFEAFPDSGILVKHNLLDDHFNITSTAYYTEEYSNYVIYLECKGTISLPNQATAFNVFATYDHVTIDVDGSISLSLDTSGSSMGIGYEITDTIDRTNIVTNTPIQYTP